jgi:hypothetical protein
MYCDESTHLENDGLPFMIIAYVSSPWNQVKIHSRNIKNLRAKYRYKGEIKWTKLSESNYLFFKELVDYFFSTDLNFRAVIVEKDQIDNQRTGFSYDDFYYKMYYQLLHHKVDMGNNYNVYLDIKDTCSPEKIMRLRGILNMNYGNIRNIQSIHSYESILMQLTDVLMGAINYNLRKQNKVIAKIKLIDTIKNHSNLTLSRSTSKYASKMNLFFIELQ